uniref:Interferon kappa n=1 Tax=Anser brachyrhynchus TaxID=132585 RepID=A0A8B9CHG8_9AVES
MESQISYHRIFEEEGSKIHIQPKIYITFYNPAEIKRKWQKKDNEVIKQKMKVQRKVIENSLQLLDKMGKKFPQQCLREKMSFRFPEQVLKPKQKETVKMAIEEIFQHIFYIFSKNLTLAAWDGAALEQFQNGLYHQIEQLEACVTKKQTQYFWSKEVNRLKLKKYFQKIDCFLKDKQHNLCSWEISRAEMRRCLQLIDKVVRKLYN